MISRDEYIQHVDDLLGNIPGFKQLLDEAGSRLAAERYVPTAEELATASEDWATYDQDLRALQRDDTRRHRVAQRTLDHLQTLTQSQVKHLERFVCFCQRPKNGCRLVTAYRVPGPSDTPLAGNPTLLLVTHTRTGEVASFPDWPLTDNLRALDLRTRPIRCAHGHGTFPDAVPVQTTGELLESAGHVQRRRIVDLLATPGVEWTPKPLVLPYAAT